MPWEKSTTLVIEQFPEFCLDSIKHDGQNAIIAPEKRYDSVLSCVISIELDKNSIRR